MAKKSATSKGKEPATTLAVQDPAPGAEVASPPASLGDDERWLPRQPVVKVNPNSLAELKTTLDDTVREFFSLNRHNFQVSHRHEDVRLILGWTSVAIALGTTYYSYKVDDFQATKTVVAIGVSLYVVLNTILALYVQYYEKDLIWVGKRRTIAARISTETLEISSVATASRTGPSTSSSASWIPFPLSLLNSSRSTATKTPTAGEKSADSDDVNEPESDEEYPRYTLTLQYTHSANANKSLLGEHTLVLTKHVGNVFDREGRIARDEVEKWLREGFERITSGRASSGIKEVETR
ncbi:hypothetical protein JCM11491_003132 [Sporobolomyces phaffii]